MKTKTDKTPLMMAESDALSYWPVTIVPESKLSHMVTAHYGLVPRLSHHSGKNLRFALKNQILKTKFCHVSCFLAIACFFFCSGYIQYG